MSEKEKDELTEDELKEAAGGLRAAKATLGHNQNPDSGGDSGSGGGVFTGHGDTVPGEEIPPPYWTR